MLMSDGLIGAASILTRTSCSPIVGKCTCSSLSNKKKTNYVYYFTLSVHIIYPIALQVLLTLCNHNNTFWSLTFMIHQLVSNNKSSLIY